MASVLAPEIGTVFASDYRIEKRLTAGGMGAIYVVHQISTGKKRALKMMLPELVEEPGQRKRFEQEARVGSLISSKHVVEVHAAGVDAGSGAPWLVMELLQGETLDALVQRQGPLAPSRVREVFEQLSHALSAAHTAGIVHRDLKPENIFMAKSELAGEKDVVKVLDFGIAKLTADNAGPKTTDAMGSPLWMAPEQTERSAVKPSTDVWAMGLIAYYLLTGKYFWRSGNREDTSIAQVMREILFEPIPNANERAREQGCVLPPSFAEWFARCVCRDTASRFVTANPAWLDLDRRLLDVDQHSNAAAQSTAATASPFAETLQDSNLAAAGPHASSSFGANKTTNPVAIAPAPEAPQSDSSGAPSGPRRLLWLIAAPIIVAASIATWFGVRSQTQSQSMQGMQAAGASSSPNKEPQSIAADAGGGKQSASAILSATDSDAGAGIITSTTTDAPLPSDAGDALKDGGGKVDAGRGLPARSPAMARMSTSGPPAVRAKLLSAVPAIEACFRKTTASKESKGVVNGGFSIDEEGKPTDFGQTVDMKGASIVAPCVENPIRSLRFDPSLASSNVSFQILLLPEGSLWGGHPSFD